MNKNRKKKNDLSMAASSSTKTIVVIRHAHRNKKEGREVDNGLSKKGAGQAKKLKKYFLKRFKRERPLILSSPKKRCVETVEPIAKTEKVKIEATPLLDEGENLENKVDALMKSIKRDTPHVVVLCSHADLIPVLIQKMIGTSVELDKGGWAEFQLEGDQGELKWLLQGFE